MRIRFRMPRCAGWFAAACLFALVPFATHVHAQDPVLSQMLPSTGLPGTQVTIRGEKFGAKKGNSTVTFAGAIATVHHWEDNVIVVTVPQDAAAGDAEIVVTIDQVKEDYPGMFAVQEANHLSPVRGNAGTRVTITGSGFGATKGASKVFFGATEAKSIKQWSDKQLTVEVPDPGTVTDPALSVTVKVGSVTKQEGTFTFIGATTAPGPNAPPAPLKAKLDKDSGRAGTTVKITGTGFGSAPGKNKVKFGALEAKVPDGKWTDTEIDAVVPDEHAATEVDLPVAIVNGNDDRLFDAGTFKETPPATAKVDHATGNVGTALKITGSGFGTTQGKVMFGGVEAKVLDKGWTDSEIDVDVPDLHSGISVKSEIRVLDSGQNTIAFAGTFTVDPADNITPYSGVAGSNVTITGANLPAAQGSNQVMFSDDAAKVSGTIVSWDKNGITVKVPELVTGREARDAKLARDANRDKQTVNAAQNEDDQLDVQVVDANGHPLEGVPVLSFRENPPQWSDKDENPLNIKFVGGYEQGFQSAQASSSDAFLAVYGHSLFLHDTFGPFFHIRLQTAPQASDTYGVTSVLSNPSGQVTSQNLKSVGSAVDMSLGLEHQMGMNFHQGQTSFSLIASAGFVTPLQANSVSATYTMPPFGTVECTELQSRLAKVLTGPSYVGIKANSTGSSTDPCFSNATATTSTGITLLQYAAPDQPNFFPKYSVGVRVVNRFAGSTGLKQCDENNHCERGYVDFTLGQNASISGGTMKHMVVNIDSIHPMPIPSLNFIYIFGSVSKRLHGLPPSVSPLVLQTGTPPANNGPTATDLVLPLTQPDRDFYRIGVGVSLCQIFTKLTSDGKPCGF